MKKENKKVYTVANAHLDTIWSWDFEQTVREYIYNTLADNLRLFDKYPEYNFNFEGAYRYELMEEYYPELFAKMKEKVAEGRWNVCGSAYENGDVNIPSPEALFRNFLYGNGYFKDKFGKQSYDIFLPDCFGFGYALPSIARHAGLLGFSTQKLSWGSAYEVPFDIGRWYGVDGSFIYASLKMNKYDRNISKIRKWDFILDKLKNNEQFNLPLTAVYYGTGDRGGAPHERSVRVIQKEVSGNKNSDIEVISANTNEFYKALDSLDSDTKALLPKWDNELLMSTHAVGSYVSRSIGKRWNRKAEELADMAERACVHAYILGREYPSAVLEKAWKRVISHQFHDDITGTSVQRAYRRCWNDYALSINQFENEYVSASKYAASRLDTSWVTGRAVVVNNSLEYERCAVVEIDGNFKGESYILKDKDGNIYPCQKVSRGLLAYIKIKGLSFKAFDLCEGECNAEVVSVSEQGLENEYLTVKINGEGFVSSVYDKELNKELLASPIRLALYDYFGSEHWPAWEIMPENGLENPQYPALTKAEVTTSGCCRGAVRLEYSYKESKFVTVVSLDRGARRVEFQNEIMWHQRHTLAKQEFSLTAENETATFDLGLGAIKRKNRTKQLYEVPAQKWADITDKSGDFGVSLISDSKYSWDKFSDNTLRLTVLHTPMKNYRIDSMQSMMDLGLNLYGFAITAHKGAELSETNRSAREFHQPLTAFIGSVHGGVGSELSLGSVDNAEVTLRALKKAEKGNSVVARFNNTSPEAQRAVFRFNCPVNTADEILASEEKIGKADFNDNSLSIDFSRYAVKSFSLECDINECESTVSAVEFDGNCAVYSANGDKKKDLIPQLGLSLPSELVKGRIYTNGICFELSKDKKALLADGREINLGKEVKRAHLLCACLNGDKSFKINKQPITVNSLTERYGAWDLYDYGETAYIKGGKLGFEFTHCHSQKGDEIARGLYFWVVSVDTENGVLSLPDDRDLLIIAISADSKNEDFALATALSDRVEKREFTFKMSPEELKLYKKYKRYSKMNDKGRYLSTKNK